MTTIQHVPTPYSYSSAVVAGDFVFLGLHRAGGDTFAAQCRGTLENIRTTLARLNLPMGQLVKVNVWLRNIKDLPEMEKLFVEFFEKDQFPARMTATTEFVDDDCLIMIEGTAYIRHAAR